MSHLACVGVVGVRILRPPPACPGVRPVGLLLRVLLPLYIYIRQSCY